MMTASLEDKPIVAEILVSAFKDNLSINYLISQDRRRAIRLRRLMEYAFDACYNSGKVFLSDDKRACALLLYPDQRKQGLHVIIQDIRLVLFSIGLARAFRAMAREAKIKRRHPTSPFAYLWFIGVEPYHQQKGIGTNLLKEVLTDCALQKRSVYLETSTLQNVPWYEKLGFEQYDTLNLGYTLYFFKHA